MQTPQQSPSPNEYARQALALDDISSPDKRPAAYNVFSSSKAPAATMTTTPPYPFTKLQLQPIPITNATAQQIKRSMLTASSTAMTKNTNTTTNATNAFSTTMQQQQQQQYQPFQPQQTHQQQILSPASAALVTQLMPRDLNLNDSMHSASSTTPSSFPQPIFIVQQPAPPLQQQHQQPYFINHQQLHTNGATSHFSPIQHQQQQHPQQQQLNSSFLNNTSSQSTSYSASTSGQANPKTISHLNDMLQRSREGIHKLSADLDGERTRRIALEHDVNELKLALSNEKLTLSTTQHSLQNYIDKEVRLMRELGLSTMQEKSVKVELAEVREEQRKEKEEKIRMEERYESLSDELRTVQDALAKAQQDLQEKRELQNELHQSQVEVSTLKVQYKQAQDDLTSKIALIQAHEQSIATLTSQLTQQDHDKSSSNLEYHSLEQRYLHEVRTLNHDLEVERQRNEVSQQENVKLNAMIQSVAQQMNESYTKQQSDLQSIFDSRLHDVSLRMQDMSSRQLSLGKLVHEHAVLDAKMQERMEHTERELEEKRNELEQIKLDYATLKGEYDQQRDEFHSKQSECELVKQELLSVKQDNLTLRSEQEKLRDDFTQKQQEHSTTLLQLQEKYSHDMQHIERSSLDASVNQAQDQEEYVRVGIEGVLDHIEKELERNVQSQVRDWIRMSENHVNGGTSVSPLPSASSQNIFHSPSSAFNSLNHSNSPNALLSSSYTSSSSQVPVSSSSSTSLPSSYLSCFTLFHSTLSSKLSSSLTTLTSYHQKREYELSQTLALMKQDLVYTQERLKEAEKLEGELHDRLSTQTSQSNEDIKKLKQELIQAQNLLEERASVIRELKKRYKREQTNLSSVQSQLQSTMSELTLLKSQHVHELESLRNSASHDLNHSLVTSEMVAQARLETENKLRRRAEEEAEKYVRACQASEERVFLLQQEKEASMALFREVANQNTAALVASHAAAASIASSAASSASTSSNTFHPHSSSTSNSASQRRKYSTTSNSNSTLSASRQAELEVEARIARVMAAGSGSNSTLPPPAASPSSTLVYSPIHGWQQTAAPY